MHFSIPDTQELYAELTGTTYTGYNIYINGNYHCCLRYKQLHALHEQLRRRCADLNIQLPAAFPPKRLLPLTTGQLESRRASLEHYLQLCGQDAIISKMEHFQSYLLNAQQETTLAEGVLSNEYNGSDLKRVSVVLEVWLSNDFTLQVNCHIGDNASSVLRTVCECVQLPTQFMRHFCLYLVCRKDSDTTQNKSVLLRRLMDFESPYLSRLRAQEYTSSCQVMVRKSYWNPLYDLSLLQEPVSLKLLFEQTASDIENGWIIAAPDVLQKLASMREHGLQKEYIQAARQLPLYGCLQFSASLIDYPEPRTTALISIGNRELSMRTATAGKIYETKFRVTRMRCWRVTAMHNTNTSDLPNSNSAGDNANTYLKSPTNLQLAFEYLMSKQNLRWITITSSQAMLMSVCLQSMVDELLNCKDSIDGLNTRIPKDTPSQVLSYVSRNGRVSHTPSMLTSSVSTPSLSTELMSSSSATTTTTTSSSSSSSSPTAPFIFSGFLS
ncbi:PREDICTED: sorting nexin-17 isoform X2 [Rhagoletis zephyria]|uniref:sorting nexin-17 isoform X2 n=1 Tax=Rhagoletis zephyria TaxID=28612 RepID=UPI0008116FD2|nr:PREDICTED: sorting nexin-17 isoform X2 [Rhagoletis zephyria]